MFWTTLILRWNSFFFQSFFVVLKTFLLILVFFLNSLLFFLFFLSFWKSGLINLFVLKSTYIHWIVLIPMEIIAMRRTIVFVWKIEFRLFLYFFIISIHISTSGVYRTTSTRWLILFFVSWAVASGSDALTFRSIQRTLASILLGQLLFGALTHIKLQFLFEFAAVSLLNSLLFFAICLRVRVFITLPFFHSCLIDRSLASLTVLLFANLNIGPFFSV